MLLNRLFVQMFLHQGLKYLHKARIQYVYLSAHLLQNIILNHVLGVSVQLGLFFLKFLKFLHKFKFLETQTQIKVHKLVSLFLSKQKNRLSKQIPKGFKIFFRLLDFILNRLTFSSCKI